MKKTKAVLTTQIARKVDCVAAISALSYRPKLAVCDPPYNMGQPYDAYADNKTYASYMLWTEGWISAVTEKIDKEGSMWIFVPDEWVSEVDILCRKTFKWYKKRHVIWAFTFGQRAQRNFTRSHCHLLWFTKHRTKYTFNFKDVAVPSARQLVYNDPRADPAGKPPDATWMLLYDQLVPYMTPDKDTWLESRICGTFKERKKHSPNQIPVPLMERIVAACSNEGDKVIDPFAGTCSSGVACKLLNRNWEGFDLSATCIKEGTKRIKETQRLL